MDSEIERVHGHRYDQGPLHPAVGGEEEHHEKKSVIKRVKDKAKKIKNTLGIKKHGHDHEHEHDHNEYDEEDEDDEDEEIVQAPEIHGAPKDGEEGGVAPIRHSFDKMKIYDEPHPEKETTGSHDQFSPSKIDPIPENIPSVPESFSATTETHPQDLNVDEPTKQPQAGYTDKISSVTSAIIAAKNVAASKIGYGGNKVDAQTQKDMDVDEPATQRQPGYTDKISSVTSAVTDKAISAKNVVASKIGYGRNIDNAQSQKDGENVTSAGVPIVSTENLSATENAGEPVKNQTTYTEKLSGATSALAGTAISAKNAAVSKLGYGGGDKTTATMETEDNRGNNNEKSSAGGVTGYGRQVASTVTEKLAPVYGTVAGAGTAVLSKIPGTGTGSGAHKNTDEDTSMGSPRDTETGVVGETDKGVVGMKDYIAEKLKPGEEDRALSEVISSALRKRTPGEDKAEVHKRTGSEDTPQEKRAVGEVVSDAFHKRNNEEDRYGENKPMGKVTESEEVANRLGSTEEEKSGKVSGNDSPGTGMVDKFKGAFTNWFGKGEGTNPSQPLSDSQSHESQGTTAAGEGENVSHEGERRLQESTN